MICQKNPIDMQKAKIRKIMKNQINFKMQELTNNE